MKYIIVLVLLLPAVCFATEIEFESLEEELAQEQLLDAQEKAAHIRRMSEITAMAQKTKLIVQEKESEPWLVTKIYFWGLIIVGAGGAIVSILVFASAIWDSMKFNYYMFIEYGEFAWVGSAVGPRRDARISVVTKYKSRGFDANHLDSYAWFNALGMCGLSTALIAIFVIVWPATIVAFGPQTIVAIIGWRKRKKMVFQKNLKGETKDVPI